MTDFKLDEGEIELFRTPIMKAFKDEKGNIKKIIYPGILSLTTKRVIFCGQTAKQAKYEKGTYDSSSYDDIIRINERSEKGSPYSPFIEFMYRADSDAEKMLMMHSSYKLLSGGSFWGRPGVIEGIYPVGEANAAFSFIEQVFNDKNFRKSVNENKINHIGSYEIPHIGDLSKRSNRLVFFIAGWVLLVAILVSVFGLDDVKYGVLILAVYTGAWFLIPYGKSKAR